MDSELSAWDIQRIEYYNKRIAEKREQVSVSEWEQREAILEDIKLMEDVVSRLETGAPPPKPVEQKQYYIEPEDDGCAGGACKI